MSRGGSSPSGLQTGLIVYSGVGWTLSVADSFTYTFLSFWVSFIDVRYGFLGATESFHNSLDSLSLSCLLSLLSDLSCTDTGIVNPKTRSYVLYTN